MERKLMASGLIDLRVSPLLLSKLQTQRDRWLSADTIIAPPAQWYLVHKHTGNNFQNSVI